MDTEEVLQQVSCDGYTDTGTCQMYEIILSSGRITKTISGGCLFVVPVADILSEKNLSIGASTGVFNKRKPGKENHELLLCR